MKLLTTVSLATAAWLTTISSLHLWLNGARAMTVAGAPSFKVGFLPVT